MVGQTFERWTGVIYTVLRVKMVHHTYGWNGNWKTQLVPRVELMAVVPQERAGEVIHETLPAGDLQSYGYTRLA